MLPPLTRLPQAVSFLESWQALETYRAQLDRYLQDGEDPSVVQISIAVCLYRLAQYEEAEMALGQVLSIGCQYLDHFCVLGNGDSVEAAIGHASCFCAREK